MIDEGSLVLISSVDEKHLGTGFIIDHDDVHSYILTCAHVVGNAKGKEGKVKVNGVLAEEIAIGTPNGADDLAVLRVEGLFGTPLPISKRNIGHEGLGFTSRGYQSAPSVTTAGSTASPETVSLRGTLGESNFQQIRGQGLPIKLWKLNIKDNFSPKPSYSGAPIVAEGEEHVIAVLSMQQEGRILAIPSEVLDRVWREQTHVPFTNREDEIQFILSSIAPAYYLLDAPAGYGKSALLQALQKQFSERKWLCAYQVLDSPLELDELAEEVAKKLSIWGLLSRSTMSQDAGYRLGSALQKYWDNSQEGIVLLFDLDKGFNNSEFLEKLLNKFIPEIEESLRNISAFDRGDTTFRVIIAGRYLTSYYNRLRDFDSSIINLSTKILAPFNYDVVQKSSISYLRKHTNKRARQIASHVLYLTGGHPGSMAQVLQMYKKSGMSPETFVNQRSDEIWSEIVQRVVTSIVTEFPATFGVDKLMGNNVLRYMDYAALRKLIDTLEISGVQDEFDLSDALTNVALLSWNNSLLYDDITRRLICIWLRNDKRDEFVRLCQSAQTICEELLSDNSTNNPDMWAIEYLYQSLQQHALLISEPTQRRELRDNFLSEELPKVLRLLFTGRKSKEQQSYLLRSIERDWEFMFTVNYYLRDAEYNNDAVKAVKAGIEAYFE